MVNERGCSMCENNKKKLKIVLTLDDSTDKSGAKAILDEIRDKMEADYPEILKYEVV